MPRWLLLHRSLVFFSTGSNSLTDLSLLLRCKHPESPAGFHTGVSLEHGAFLVCIQILVF